MLKLVTVTAIELQKEAGVNLIECLQSPSSKNGTRELSKKVVQCSQIRDQLPNPLPLSHCSQLFSSMVEEVINVRE